MSEITCKRILHVVSSMNRGGAETMIMNLYRNIDRKKVQFDFIVHSDAPGHYDDEIIKMGGKIIKCNSLGTIGPLKYVDQLSKIINENGPFHSVHAHTDFQCGFVVLAAKKAGVKNRISHSHNTQWQTNPNALHNIMLIMFRQFINIYSTEYCACGKEAAKFLFKRNKLDKVKILNNGIEIEKFLLDNTDDIRKELDIPKDTLIIGNIARFCEQKNHKFIVDLAEDMVSKNINFIILLIGEGPLFNEIKEIITSKKLEKYIKLLGVREDIPKLMNLFDVFLFPSFYEGLPVVLIEAQACGTPCVISNTISNEVDLDLDLIFYCDLNERKDKWISTIEHSRKIEKISDIDRKLKLTAKGYNVMKNTEKLLNIYRI